MDMDHQLQQETQTLTQAWAQHASADLRDYLVADVEDPRLNVQSILTRHALIDRILGQPAQPLCDHELRFACVMNWLLHRLKRGADADWLDAQLAELVMAGDELVEADPATDAAAQTQNEADEAAETTPPAHLRETAALLAEAHAADAAHPAVPDYVVDALSLSDVELSEQGMPERILETFQQLWAHWLGQVTVESPLRVLEPACGSANDYRFLDAFGLSAHLDYHGFDLCQANINNACALFPQQAERFFVGNVFAIDAPDNRYDVVFTHDLLEHLSPRGIEAAITELCRVTADTLIVHFFNLEDRDEHVIQPTEDYYWNVLSLPRLRERFQAHGGHVEALHVPSFLAERFNFHESHNQEAWTLTVRFA
jgi:hypothetical protein